MISSRSTTEKEPSGWENTYPQCIPIARFALISLNKRTLSCGAQWTGETKFLGSYALKIIGQYPTTNKMFETKAIHPIGIKARSKPPNLSPISLNAGHTGRSSSFSPSNTARYPVSPPKNTFTSFDSTTHEAQSVLNRSKIPRPVKCWQGVQVSLNSSVRGAPVSTALGRPMVMFRLSHQSRQWKRSAGIPIEEK